MQWYLGEPTEESGFCKWQMHKKMHQNQCALAEMENGKFKVGSFCYLGDMLDEGGGVNMAIIARIGQG